jgi:hypothetical protein
MPRRSDISKILLLGSGPIVIGQAAEFDYSGAQACKVLLEEGYEVVLVNSNPATIMTDPEFATATYVEPLTPESVERVIERERPDALLPTLGGGTALNLARELHESGALDRHGVELIGANYEAIARAEDRLLFRETMERAGLRVPRSMDVRSMADGERALELVGLPAIFRPGFTMGGAGGGIAYTEAEFRERVAEGLAASPIGEVLVEAGVLTDEQLERALVAQAGEGGQRRRLGEVEALRVGVQLADAGRPGREAPRGLRDRRPPLQRGHGRQGAQAVGVAPRRVEQVVVVCAAEAAVAPGPAGGHRAIDPGRVQAGDEFLHRRHARAPVAVGQGEPGVARGPRLPVARELGREEMHVRVDDHRRVATSERSAPNGAAATASAPARRPIGAGAATPRL